MNIRYVSQEIEWTQPMKDCVRAKIVEPLQRFLKTSDFELSVHLQIERKRTDGRKPRYEMWTVLQTFDGGSNEVVRRQSADFYALTNEISSGMRARLKKKRAFKPRFLNVKQLFSFAHTA
jgi:ribosome-associated translation inhibitor RaiA